MGIQDTVIRAIALREAGKVVRNHTMPVHRECRLAEHCYNMVTLYFLLCPAPKLEVVRAITVHDFPERWLGDVPAPAKKEEDLLLLQERIMTHFELSYELTPADEKWVIAVDKLDLFLWGEDETAMGNRNVEQMQRRLRNWFAEHANRIPYEVRNFYEKFQWRRLDDGIPE